MGQIYILVGVTLWRQVESFGIITMMKLANNNKHAFDMPAPMNVLHI
jgi:hypothetical protein